MPDWNGCCFELGTQCSAKPSRDRPAISLVCCIHEGEDYDPHCPIPHCDINQSELTLRGAPMFFGLRQRYSGPSLLMTREWNCSHDLIRCQEHQRTVWQTFSSITETPLLDIYATRECHEPFDPHAVRHSLSQNSRDVLTRRATCRKVEKHFDHESRLKGE